MNWQILRLLETEEVQRIVAYLEQANFVDGRLTAHGKAREVKRNLQINAPEEGGENEKLIAAALERNQDFVAFAFPKRMRIPMFNRYDVGMEYGPHIDLALMAGLRTDLAVTVFLSSPASYDGGELVMDLPSGQEEIKLDAGEAVVYPASTLHHVARVTRGVRLAAVTWVQSAVSDERIRAILHDIGRYSRENNCQCDGPLRHLLTRSYQNLLRYAAEP